ncbi:hypothetical protein [Dongia sp.]|uniref:hypothetical protein n=1 Tax=Dongia sp. TaxID=1977262 RepID=UPI0035B31141
MRIRYGLSIAALMALVGSAALAQNQNNAPTDPTAPGGGTCTGFPGDPANCPRQDERPNQTIPEDPGTDMDTNSGDDSTAPNQTAPDENNQQQLPNGASPDSGVPNPTP